MQRIWASCSRKRRIMIRLTRIEFEMHCPVFMTLENWNDENDKYISYMPDIPRYPSAQIEAFFDSFWEKPLAQDYGRKIKITRELERGISIHAHITLPDLEARAAHRLEERLEHFIDEELSLIENGY